MTFWLFFISFYASVFTENLTWVILNGALVLTSYLVDFKIQLDNVEISSLNYLVEVDYLCIFLISICYLNDFTTNTVLSCAALYEFVTTGTIDTIKNVALGIGLIKCYIYCYTINIFIFLNLLWFSIIGVYTYIARKVYFERNKNKRDIVFYNFLTLIWRVCALIILLSASFTMEEMPINIKI
jgi:hypothetical protein